MRLKKKAKKCKPFGYSRRPKSVGKKVAKKKRRRTSKPSGNRI